jgi:hypothetical protein
MDSEARAALREKVFAITKVCAEPCKPDANDCPCRVDADAAINLVLEEAARELDRWGDIYGDNAAATIRAMKGKATSPESGAPDADQPPAIR